MSELGNRKIFFIDSDFSRISALKKMMSIAPLPCQIII
jgi:hypothetical protein